MARARQTARFSVQVTATEKQTLDDAAKRAGTNRNKFIRRWIATLAQPTQLTIEPGGDA